MPLGRLRSNTRDADATRSHDSDLVLTALGQVMSRSTLIYAAGLTAIFPLTFLSVLVTTAFLAPEQFGELGLLITLAGMLTVVYNLGSLQGTLMWIYGAGEADDGDIIDASDENLAPRAEKRRALGSGLLVTIAASALGTALVLAFAGPLRGALGGGTTTFGVALAGLCALTGAVWRLVLQVFRMERRPTVFSLMNAARPLVCVGLTAMVLTNGGGVNGALAALAAGNLIVVILAFSLSRHNYEFRPRRHDFTEIFSRGKRYTPVVVGLWISQNADLLFLSHYASGTDLGLYRLASRLGVFPTYITAAFLMTWAPLLRSPLMSAATERHGGRERLNAKLFTYFCILSFGLLFAFALAADELVRVAGGSYAPAGSLIPVVTAGAVMGALFHAVFRASTYGRRIFTYAACAVLSAVLFVAFCLLLIPGLESYGAALAVLASLGATVVVSVLAVYASENPVPFEWGRIAGAFAVAAVCGSAFFVRSDLIWVEVLVRAVAVVAFPVLLVATGVIARGRVRTLIAIARDLLPRRARDRELILRLNEVSRQHREVVLLALRDGWSPEAAASHLETTTPVVYARFARAVRAAGGIGGPGPLDAEIGRHLVDRQTTAESDASASLLARQGLDRFELYQLERACLAMRRAATRHWQEPTLYASVAND